MRHPYKVINLIFAGIILFIMVYSGIFSAENEHPIDCVYQKTHNIPCATCGLSKSFSEMLRGNFDKANDYNENGMPLFSFFIIQLMMRVLGTIIFSKNLINTKVLITTDALVSILLFLYCFRNLILI